MPTLVNKDYFISEINIAGLQSPAVQISLALFIGKREPEYIEAALGYAFAKLLTAGITDTDGRWYELKTGAEYTNRDGHTKKWTGLVNAALLSPIANYTYYWAQRDGVTFSTTVGEMEGKTENAKPVSPVPKMMRAWNEMVDQTRLLHDFLLHKKDGDGALVYPEFCYSEVRCNDVASKMSWL